MAPKTRLPKLKRAPTRFDGGRQSVASSSTTQAVRSFRIGAPTNLETRNRPHIESSFVPVDEVNANPDSSNQDGAFVDDSGFYNDEEEVRQSKRPYTRTRIRRVRSFILLI